MRVKKRNALRAAGREEEKGILIEGVTAVLIEGTGVLIEGTCYIQRLFLGYTVVLSHKTQSSHKLIRMAEIIDLEFPDESYRRNARHTA